jgi:hypothetical protein
MVRAILEGRKSVTRRAVKGGQIPTEDTSITVGERQRWSAIGQRDPRYGFCVFGSTEAECAKELEEFAPCPHGRRGERLWVRETWYCDHVEVQRGPYLKPADMVDLGQAREDGDLVYAADGLTPYEQEQPTWKPSIHMPRWASRILLEITDVRVERLQDGDGETDFESRYLAEGINRIHHGDGEYHYHAFKTEAGPGNWNDPFDAWRELWVSVNGADSWNTNPWVWVVEFKRVMP